MLSRKKPLSRNLPKPNPDSALKKWYEEGIAISTWICENCGAYIPHESEYQRYSAQCHILPKDKFDSVKLHHLNRVHLCLRCHNDYDSSWARAQIMRVWFPTVIQRIKLFVHKVTEILPLQIRIWINPREEI